jgi:hypothetical protein
VASASALVRGRFSSISQGIAAYWTSNRTSSFVSSNGVGCQKKYATTHAAMIANVTTGRRETGLSS